MPAEERIEALARTFPCLVQAPGNAFGWNPRELDMWASQAGQPESYRLAASFVLHVWNRDAGWRCGPFDMFRALEIWDGAHREAFARYAADPWLL